MSLADIRDAITTTVAGIANIGIVTDFDPVLTREEDFKEFFVDPGLGYVLGWCVTRERSDETDASTEQNWREHRMVIKGYRGAREGSLSAEKDFQDLIEDVCSALRARIDDALGQTVSILGPPNVRSVKIELFGVYLVHAVEIVVLAREMIVTS